MRTLSALFHISVSCILLLHSHAVYAQAVPNTAEAGRLPQKPTFTPEFPDASPPVVTESMPAATPPPVGAESITVTFDDILIKGATALPSKEAARLTAPYIGKPMPLSHLWKLADEVTAYYRSHGYFLSRAFVPAQEVEGGSARIEVMEGYIAEVDIPEKYAKDTYLRSFKKRLTQQRPISARMLERELLLLNDAFNERFQARLEAFGTAQEDIEANTTENGIRLVLENTPEATVTGGVSVNNYGSRYMGSYQANGSATIRSGNHSETQLFGGVSHETEEMKHIYARHDVHIAAGWEVSAYAAYSNAVPGYSLQNSDIDSDSTTLGLEVSYAAIRQRLSNLDIRLNLEGRNVDSDLQNTVLTRDRVRALRIGGRYENRDAWHGFNTVDVTFSHGLDVFGSSSAGDLNLSRASAEPDFRKLEFFLQRAQLLGETWIATLGINGQYAFDPLYSSEEFGYGGIGFGRAYDSSELLGDSGIAAALEIGYNGLPAMGKTQLQPFVFVDGGSLWNRDAGQERHVTAYSTGFGVHAFYGDAFRVDATLAFPLNRPVEAPQSGNDKNPRALVQLQYLF